MNRTIYLLFLLAVTMPAHADLQPPARTLQPITDPANVVNDRGTQLEIFPSKRATPQYAESGRMMTHRVTIESASTPIGPQHLGVVFNHAMQQQGYITGEIAFRLKAGHTASAMRRALYPGLKKITNSNVYIVVAHTPAEFMTVLKRLQARGDLELVEPTSTYGSTSTNPSSR